MTKKTSTKKFKVSQSELSKTIKSFDQNRHIELKTQDMIFFEGSKQHLTCGKCGLIPFDPHQCYTCNHILCGDEKCTCNCNIIQFENNKGNSDGPQVKPINNLVQEHIFDKIYFVHDCNPERAQTDFITAKIYSYKEMIKHFQECDYKTCIVQSERKVSCPKKCAETKQMTRDELIEHLNTECEQMEMECITCYQMAPKRNIINRKLNQHTQKQCIQRLRQRNSDTKEDINILQTEINRQSFRRIEFDDSWEQSLFGSPRHAFRDNGRNGFVRQDTGLPYTRVMRQIPPIAQISMQTQTQEIVFPVSPMPSNWSLNPPNPFPAPPYLMQNPEPRNQILIDDEYLPSMIDNAPQQQYPHIYRPPPPVYHRPLQQSANIIRRPFIRSPSQSSSDDADVF